MRSMSPRRILIVKTSSMGDVVHALPALTDLRAFVPSAQIDWVVEAPFASIVQMHPGVNGVIASNLRSWRKSPFAPKVRHAFSAFKTALQQTDYDAIVDLQGLVKSAAIAFTARGVRHGFDRNSIREPLASFSYSKTHAVSKQSHAVDRNRALLAAACGYAVPERRSYGLTFAAQKRRLVVCCHATSKDDKLWPEAYWREVIAALETQNVEVGLPWGSAEEEARAARLAAGFANARVWPRDPFPVLTRDLSSAACVIGVDTGVLHLAAAAGTPVLGLYIATDPRLSGAWAGAAPVVNLGGIGRMPTVTDVLREITPWIS